MNRPLRVVLSARGTFGDIAPFIGVAKHLRSMGHRPVVAACRSFKSAVEQHGVAFAPVAPHMADVCHDLGMSSMQVMRRTMSPWSGGRFSLERVIKPYFDRIYGDLRAVCQDADVLVAHPTTAPWARLVAQERGIPWKTLVLQGMLLLMKSATEPPVLPGFPNRPLARLLGPQIYGQMLRSSARGSRGAYAFLDDKARQLGLYDPALHPVLDGMASPHGVMALFPPALLGTRLPADMSMPPVEFLGFGWFDPCNRPMPTVLEQFLAQGPPPVVFTLGASALCCAGDVYSHWSRWCERLGHRAVFIGDEASLGRAVPPTQLVLPWVSLPELLARSQAVVNAGGIGLCSQVLAAGIPQLIVPFAFDQPDNAFRIAQMGAAEVLPLSRARGPGMGRALARLTRDPALRARALQLQAQRNPVCGTLTAAQLLDEQYGLSMPLLRHA